MGNFIAPDSGPGSWKGSTATAGAVLCAMAEGRLLRHRDGWSIVTCPADQPNEDPICVPVPQAVAQELIESNQVGKLTEHRNGRKSGWRDLGITEPADYYCLVQ